QIEARTAGRLDAQITLDYDANGRLFGARSSAGGWSRYMYDDHGLLTKVESSSGSLQYRYKHGLITDVLRDGATARKLQYDASGRLVGITENGDTSSIHTKTE